MARMKSTCLLTGWVLLALGMAGCLSNQPGSTSTAHAVMSFASAGEIHDALVDVFVGEDYTLEGDGETQLVFSRAATQRDQVLFGDFTTGAMSIEVVIDMVPRRDGSHLVTLNAYVIKDGGADRKIGLIGSRHYQSLLGRAEANLVSADVR